MRRVIYAWNYLEWGGAQIHFLALIREARKEFETIVILPTGTGTQLLGFLRSEGVRYEEFDGAVDLKPASGIAAKLARHRKRIKSELAMLRKIEEIGLIDAIVHTDILPAQSLLSLIWLCIRSQVFITSHNAMPPVLRWRWLLWKVKFGIISRFDSFHVFCTNRHAAEYFRRLYGRRVGDEIRITYDSINPAEIDSALSLPIDREALLSKLNIPTDKFIVLAVGQFIDRKGRWTFLHAAKQIVAQRNDIHFVWVTPALPDPADVQKITDHELGDKFSLVRSDDIGTERKDILSFFRVANVYALPSFVEGLPISLLEAMAMGIPSISTNVYGIPEALIDEQTGLLIEPGDASALAATIIRMRSDEDLRRRLSAAGRQHVIEHFDDNEAARTAISAYRSAIKDDK